VTTRIIVQVSAGTLEDAKHEQGANFLPGICDLLSDGCIVEVKTNSKAVTFDSSLQFTAWFKDYVGLLRKLHLRLEAQGDKSDDWAAARHLESELGAGPATDNQIVKAKALLAKYGN
jgi:hypothetical protein